MLALFRHPNHDFLPFLPPSVDAVAPPGTAFRLPVLPLALRRLEREGAAPPALPVACACAPPAQREAALQREATRHELARHETTHRAARARTTRDDRRCRWRLPRFWPAPGRAGHAGRE